MVSAFGAVSGLFAALIRNGGFRGGTSFRTGPFAWVRQQDAHDPLRTRKWVQLHGDAPTRRLVLILPLLASHLLLTGCDDFRFPGDPDGTLETILATQSMTVAVTRHDPWVRFTEAETPDGAEVDLVEALAEAINVRIIWQELSAFDAFEALESGEADLAIGGFTREEVNAYGTAAPSYVYFEEALVVAARPGLAVPDDIERLAVFLPRDIVAEKLVRERGGRPVRRPSEADLVALPHWQVAAQGLVPTGIVLERRKHVVAIPKGENAWLMRLERFLRQDGPAVADALRDHGG
jgi:polar amino acid transport system substrate-binding protein